MSEIIIVKPNLGHFDNWYSYTIALPTVDFWWRLGCTPNMLTFLGFYFSVLFAIHFYLGQRLAFLFLVLRMYFDYADGLMARKYHQSSDFGDIFDHLSDWFFMVAALVVTLLNRTMTEFYLLCAAGILLSMQLETVEQACQGRVKHSKMLQTLRIFDPFVSSHTISELLKFTDTSFFYFILSVIVLLF